MDDPADVDMKDMDLDLSEEEVADEVAQSVSDILTYAMKKVQNGKKMSEMYNTLPDELIASATVIYQESLKAEKMINRLRKIVPIERFEVACKRKRTDSVKEETHAKIAKESVKTEVNEDVKVKDNCLNIKTTSIVQRLKDYIKNEESGQQIVDECKNTNIDDLITLITKNDPPRCKEQLPKQLTDNELRPLCPSVLVSSRKTALSPNLMFTCYKSPIISIRGLTKVLDIDLGKFSSRTLVETHPNHKVEVRTQVQQSLNDNVDAVSGMSTWTCLSHREHTTVQKYAKYQATSYYDIFDAKKAKLSDTDQSQSQNTTSNKCIILTKKIKQRRKFTFTKITSSCSLDAKRDGKRYDPFMGLPTIKFGTNVDLSDGRKWRTQLEELQKLPPFMRIVSPANMLSHVSHVILGMNTVQLYMKVPGSRTPGHQENNNFCSVNINVGPGNCEWFATPNRYWSIIDELCEKNKINYLHGSWWPDMDELRARNVPVYRFIQSPGDVVWVNSGCVHWVQATGYCNNIAWNVGPLNVVQYSLAMDRYDHNKLQLFKSIVPMVHLSWNLARNVKIPEQRLYYMIKHTLKKTLKQSAMILNFATNNNVPIKFHGRDKNEPSHYCGLCECEVFNILLVKEVTNEKRLHRVQHIVYCFMCARKSSPNLSGFLCLQEYELDDLIVTYDNFKLWNRRVSYFPTFMYRPTYPFKCKRINSMEKPNLKFSRASINDIARMPIEPKSEVKEEAMKKETSPTSVPVVKEQKYASACQYNQVEKVQSTSLNVEKQENV